MSATVHRVAVDATPVWQRADAPRATEAAIIADEPDHPAWLAAMDSQSDDRLGRIGLLSRIETEALSGEPVEVHHDDGVWSQVTLPWQPSSKDPRGYPGYVRSAHLRSESNPATTVGSPAVGTPQDATDVNALLRQVRTHLGTHYLWGGLSDAGLDCSGLIHVSYRRLGIVIPRDAHDQAAAATPVALGSERPGDLYFFARPGRPVHHVGMVVTLGTMVHAPQTGAAVVEEPLTVDRRATLAAAGRFAVE